MATFDLGRVTPIYKGDYSASASYELNDVVLYNGNLYWHVKATATVGILPTDTTVWKLAFADGGVRAEIRGYADDAQASAEAASASATSASTSATSAQSSATSASQSATQASTSATNASTSASLAQEYAEQAEESAAALSDINERLVNVEDDNLVSEKYLNDIATISIDYGKYDKDTDGVTVELRKRIINGAISAHSSYSFIQKTVDADGFFYCTSTPTDSNCCIWSGEPLSTDTLLKRAAKADFPTAANPWMVKAGQVVAVCGKTTTAASQVIYLADYGTASITSVDTVIDDLDAFKRGHVTAPDIATFRFGRYSQSDNTIHSSPIIVCNSAPIQLAYDAVFIADIGYAMDVKMSEDNVTYSWRQRECAYFVPANQYVKMNMYEIGGTVAPSEPNGTANHIRVINTSVQTSDYYRYHDTFFGMEMYNTVGFIGDSYSARRSTYNNNWTTILAKTKGFEPTLYAHSGYTTTNWISAILPTLLADDAKDFYWLAMGINDAAKAAADSTYVGSEADLSGEYTSYPDTFWGNYGRIIESIQNHAPKARMVISTVIYHDMFTAQGNNGSTNIPVINEAVRGIAEHYGIPCIELADDIFYRSPEYQDNMQATAYTHPDPILFTGMANANARLFSKAVAKNPEYFKTSTAE